MFRQAATALASSGAPSTATKWIREYLRITYGTPHVDSTEDYPAQISALAAALTGGTSSKRVHLDRLARQALEHSVAQPTATHPRWHVLGQRERWTVAPQ